MNRNNYPLYALLAAGVAAIALLVGMPPVYLVVLACPVMMLFMMRGMNSGQNQNRGDHLKDAIATPKSSDRSDQPR